jgi:catechol 2,3-dioxygenase-like lactoylglutathione lyase family enzyme
LSGDWLSEATAIKDARISGIHLRLPGYDENGPTLEIFQYGSMPSRPEIVLNTPGISHIAFAVDDVAAMAEAVRSAGGGDVGKLTEIKIPGSGFLVFQYLADPEGNIIELQKWTRKGNEFA